MSSSIQEAYDKAQAALGHDAPEPMEISQHQIDYAYRTSKYNANFYTPRGAISDEDLIHIGVEAILIRVKKGMTGTRWMGKAARWAMADALNKEFGRRGLTRQGSIRLERYQTEIQEEDSWYEPDLDLAMDVENAIFRLPRRQKEVALLLNAGYRNTEIANILGVTPAAITLRRQSVNKAWRHEGIWAS